MLSNLKSKGRPMSLVVSFFLASFSLFFFFPLPEDILLMDMFDMLLLTLIDMGLPPFEKLFELLLSGLWGFTPPNEGVLTLWFFLGRVMLPPGPRWLFSASLPPILSECRSFLRRALAFSLSISMFLNKKKNSLVDDFMHTIKLMTFNKLHENLSFGFLEFKFLLFIF